MTHIWRHKLCHC